MKIFWVILFFCILPLYAQENAGRITSIEIIGLKRTKPHVAIFPLEKFLGRESREFDPNEVFAAVKDTNVLEPVSAELVISAGEELMLRVTVVEKWTFFLVPRMSIGSSGENYGLYMIDVNMFGLRDWLEFEGSYSPQGWWYGGARYIHTSSRKYMPGWNLSFRYNYGERIDVDRNEFLRRRYTTRNLRSSLGLNYSFTDNISASISFFFQDTDIVKMESDISPPDMNVSLLGFHPVFSLHRRSWDGFLLSGQSISLGRYGV